MLVRVETKTPTTYDLREIEDVSRVSIAGGVLSLEQYFFSLEVKAMEIDLDEHSSCVWVDDVQIYPQE